MSIIRHVSSTWTRIVFSFLLALTIVLAAKSKSYVLTVNIPSSAMFNIKIIIETIRAD